MGLFLSNLLQVAFLALWLLILGRVLISWFDPVGRTQLGAFLVSTTEPILAPIRRALPQTGMVDFSPLIVLIVLSVLWRLL
ncbi:MAG TPA: YggT family protein [Candidatus Limnocylindrales bacterium]|nr:YggT family protein [Candidatus Limnocylindrales bacterium]